MNSCEMRINLSSRLATHQSNLQNVFFSHHNVVQYLEAVRMWLSQVVLKLCNRSRAAGVIVVPFDELDEVLEEILMPPPLLRSIQEVECHDRNDERLIDWHSPCFEEN